jgi:hypothetical protein
MLNFARFASFSLIVSLCVLGLQTQAQFRPPPMPYIPPIGQPTSPMLQVSIKNPLTSL